MTIITSNKKSDWAIRICTFPLACFVHTSRLAWNFFKAQIRGKLLGDFIAHTHFPASNVGCLTSWSSFDWHRLFWLVYHTQLLFPSFYVSNSDISIPEDIEEQLSLSSFHSGSAKVCFVHFMAFFLAFKLSTRFHGGSHFKTISAVIWGIKVESAQSLSIGNSLVEKKEMPISQTHGRQTNHHSSVTAMYTRFHLDVASTLRLTGTSLCNRPSRFFLFIHWKFNLSGTRWKIQFCSGQFVASPVRLLHT